MRTCCIFSGPLLQGLRQYMPLPVRVLLTNDDGPESTFFQAWVRHVRDVLK